MSSQVQLMTEHSKPHLVLIRPQGLHKLVVEQIQQMIIEGALAPGTRLNERLLCEKLGVSRTPLREALKILAAVGLVELLPNRGAAVVQLSAKDVAETFEVISHLESMAGRDRGCGVSARAVFCRNFEYA